MVRRGAMTAAEASTNRFRHVITNVLGGNEGGVEVELHKLNLEPEDRLMLCSDGLTEMVPEAEIANILQANPDPKPASERLIMRALEMGGKDNVTVVVAHFAE